LFNIKAVPPLSHRFTLTNGCKVIWD